MAQSVLHRPRVAVALATAALALAGCGVNERDPRRFEALADTVAAIPVSVDADRPKPSSPKPAPLKVELLSPHQLWDARDAAAGRARPAAAPEPTAPPRASVATAAIQLGAFASEEGARAAWARLGRGPDAAVLDGLDPLYEGVEVGGRRLVRLKVAAAPERAQALCRVLAASDPWCARGAAQATDRRPSTGAA